MKSKRVESEALPNQSTQSVITAPASPQDVERFLKALRAESRKLAHGDSGNSGDDPALGDNAFAQDTADNSELGRSRTSSVLVPPMAMPLPQTTPARPVTAVRRAALGTHLERARAMQPLAELLAAVRERAVGNNVSDLKIVPPEPNVLQLTLHLSMTDGEFVVMVRTALGADRRDEVKQALHVLQASLTARLQIPARVVLV